MTRTAVQRVSLLAMALLVGCLGDDKGSISSPSDLRHAFVVLGEDGQATARAITVAATCPALSIDGARPVPMTLRATAATLPPRPTAYDKHNTTPAEFPVTVCDAQVPAGATRAAIGARNLPVPKRHPQKILLIGDTGCRMKSQDGVDLYQACNDAQQWPFKAIADLAAAQAPDVVIHVGDYHYRETACPAGNAGCAGSPYGFSWSSWEPDFFAPGQALLAAAPWILVRGDHETCDRGGQGWWRLLDPRPWKPGQDCNAAADDDIGNYSEPYAVPLGDDTQFIVFDSAVVGNKALSGSDAQFATYAAQFARAFALGATRPYAFFMNHQPILGYNSNLTPTAQPGNAALQSVLQSIVPDALFPPNVQAVLSGHVHMLQVVSFTTPQPPIFIPGNSGTELVADFTQFPADHTPLPGAVVASLLATAKFGFMTMERDGGGWVVKAWDRSGAPLTSCSLFARKAACTPLAAG
ncbi:MAG: metallophosphoesterase [Betaproteobacteria bacterium]